MIKTFKLNNTDNILNAQNLEEDYMEKAYENGFNFIYYKHNKGAEHL